jgi:hypothetical protein
MDPVEALHTICEAPELDGQILYRGLKEACDPEKVEIPPTLNKLWSSQVFHSVGPYVFLCFQNYTVYSISSAVQNFFHFLLQILVKGQASFWSLSDLL